MRRVFNADGTERPIQPAEQVEPLEFIAQLGGQFDECNFTLSFSHDALRREEISAVLSLSPTKAWNAGERHSVGINASGVTREVDWGLWCLRVEVESGEIGDALERFLQGVSAPVEEWRRLALMWNGTVALVGHTTNFNREFRLGAALLGLLAARGLGLTFDAYFEGGSEDL